jgi:hypothetical protein
MSIALKKEVFPILILIDEWYVIQCSWSVFIMSSPHLQLLAMVRFFADAIWFSGRREPESQMQSIGR